MSKHLKQWHETLYLAERIQDLLDKGFFIYNEYDEPIVKIEIIDEVNFKSIQARYNKNSSLLIFEIAGDDDFNWEFLEGSAKDNKDIFKGWKKAKLIKF